MASAHPSRIFTACALGLLAACSGKSGAPTTLTASTGAANSEASQMQIIELKPGDGPAIAAGQKAVVEYTGWLYETSAADKKGKEFDSSKNGGQPFRFTVGAGEHDQHS